MPPFRPLVAALLLATAAPVAADLVVLNNGREIQGIVVFETEHRVTLSTPGGEVTLRKDQIERIERGDVATHAAMRVEASLRSGNLASALRALSDAHSSGVEAEVLNEVLERNRDSFLRCVRRLRPSEHTEARHQVRHLRDQGFASPMVQMTFAEAFLELEAPLDASECLILAGFDYLRGEEEHREFAEGFLRRLIRELARQGRYQEAVEQIERLRLINPGEEGEVVGQVPLLHLSAAARARDEERFEDALRLIREELWPTVPEIARNRALLTLRQMAQWAERTGNERQGRVLINRYVAAILPVEAISVGQQLYRSEARRLLDHSDPERALALIRQIPEAERGEDLRRVYLQAQFYSERQKIGGRNPADLFQLSIWAADNELWDESIGLLEQLRENPALKEYADEQLALILTDYDLWILRKALEAFDRGQMQRTLELCNQVETDEGRESSTLREIRELAALARAELQMEIKRKPYDAEVVFQQAERAFFMDDADEAWNLIDVVLSNYPSTPAAERAANLLPDVARQFQVQLLEGRRRTVPSYETLVEHSELRQSEQLDKEIRLLLEAL